MKSFAIPWCQHLAILKSLKPKGWKPFCCWQKALTEGRVQNGDRYPAKHWCHLSCRQCFVGQNLSGLKYRQDWAHFEGALIEKTENKSCVICGEERFEGHVELIWHHLDFFVLIKLVSKAFNLDSVDYQSVQRLLPSFPSFFFKMLLEFSAKWFGTCSMVNGMAVPGLHHYQTFYPWECPSVSNFQFSCFLDQKSRSRVQDKAVKWNSGLCIKLSTVDGYFSS